MSKIIDIAAVHFEINVERGAPDANGVISSQTVKILNDIGKCFKPVRESFNGKSIKILSDSTLLTVRDGNTIYVHCPVNLNSSKSTLSPFTMEPEEIILMNNGSPLSWTFEPMIYRKHLDEKYLRIRGLSLNSLTGPVVIKLKIKSMLST